MRQGDLRRDRPAHGVSHEHSVWNVEGIEQGHHEADVRPVVVAGRRLVRETEPAVVKGDDPVSRGGDRCQVLASRVHRGAEPVQIHHRRTGPRVDVANAGAVDPHASRDEPRTGGEPPRFRYRRRSTGSDPEPAQQEPFHPMFRRAARATATMAGWELQTAAVASPTPLATTDCASSMMSTVGVPAATLPRTNAPPPT